MFEDTAELLASWDRPAAYHRVLFWVMKNMDPIQFRRFSIKEVAEGTKVSMSSADRALTMLTADGVLIAKEGTNPVARRLNNNLFWKSNSDRYHTEQRDAMPEDARGRD